MSVKPLQNSLFDAEEWNPRFVAFSLSFSLCPEEMADALSKRKGRMIPFIEWIHERAREFDGTGGTIERGGKSYTDPDAFTAHCYRIAETQAHERRIHLPK